MNSSRYLLGIDAGATKTHYALYDRLENRIDLLTGTAANHEVLSGGYNELRVVLADMIGELLSRNGLRMEDISGAALGMGGVDTRRQHSIISGILVDIGLKRFILANDAYLGIKAECSDGTGICAVNGSGFSVVGIDSQGRTLQIGGLGSRTGDKGGGSYLVSTMLSCIYGSLFKGSEVTSMSEDVFRLIGITSKYDYIEELTKRLHSDAKVELVMQLSRILHICANRGDAVACRILEDCGIDYVNAIRGMVKELPLLSEKPVEIILVGSNFTKCESTHAIDTIDSMLNSDKGNRQYILKPISSKPVSGAVIWAHESAGIEIDAEARNKCKMLLNQSII